MCHLRVSFKSVGQACQGFVCPTIVFYKSVKFRRVSSQTVLQECKSGK